MRGKEQQHERGNPGPRHNDKKAAAPEARHSVPVSDDHEDREEQQNLIERSEQGQDESGGDEKRGERLYKFRGDGIGLPISPGQSQQSENFDSGQGTAYPIAESEAHEGSRRKILPISDEPVDKIVEP